MAVNLEIFMASCLLNKGSAEHAPHMHTYSEKQTGIFETGTQY